MRTRAFLLTYPQCDWTLLSWELPHQRHVAVSCDFSSTSAAMSFSDIPDEIDDGGSLILAAFQ